MMAVRSIARDIRKLVLLPLAALLLSAAAFLGKFYLDGRTAARIEEWEWLRAETIALQSEFFHAKQAEFRFMLDRNPDQALHHADIISGLLEDIAGVERRVAGLEGDAVEHLVVLDEPLLTYRNSFAELVRLHRKMGYTEDDGLAGQIKETILAIELQLGRRDGPALRRLILEMRNSEREFFLRGNPVHLDAVHGSITALRNLPEDTFSTLKKRATILTHLITYQEAIGTFAATIRNAQAAREDAAAAFLAVEPLLEAAIGAISAEVAAKKRASAAIGLKVLYACIALAFVTVTIAVAMSIVIARRLRAPWQQTARVIDTLAAGRADVGMEHVHYAEVETVGRALLHFRDSVIEREKDDAARRDAVKRAADAELAETERQRREEKEEDARRSAASRDARVAREQAAVKEISDVVAAFAKGDFSRRLETSDKDGVVADVCDGLNRIGAATEGNLEDALRALDALASGVLNSQMTEDGGGIFGDIRRTVNKTVASLADIIGQIDQSSHSIDRSARELADGAGDLANRTERSASSLTETIAATRLLSDVVRGTATTANHVSQDIDEMRHRVEKSDAVLTRTIDAMGDIRAASEKISKITVLINDIAFQTNLLSLNAGVEAARAGDAGKGFAVVATEVRDLATRSAAAADEISELISDSARYVDHGGNLVGEMATALGEISHGVDNTAKRMQGLAVTAEEQVSTIAEIDRANEDLGDEMQSNAVVVENTAAAADGLHAQSAALAAIVSSFTRSAPASGRSDDARWAQASA